jgi:hypothetical protein
MGSVTWSYAAMVDRNAGGHDPNADRTCALRKPTIRSRFYRRRFPPLVPPPRHNGLDVQVTPRSVSSAR